MKNKYITIREGYEWLSVGNKSNELTLTEFTMLSTYLKDNISSNGVLYGYNKLKIINYVGIVVVGSLVIEILPKISLSNNEVKDREILIFMLSKCNKLSINIDELMKTNLLSMSLLDLLAKTYISKLMKELQKGLYSEYVTKEESLNKIKGKILLSENIKRNGVNKVKVHCRYDEFTENNLFNGILKMATLYLVNKVRDSRVVNEINTIRAILTEVDEMFISKNTLDSVRLNRKNERYKECLVLAKLILSNSSMDKSFGKENGFSILFEMNYLYEEYIGVVLNEVIKDEDIVVNTQEKSKYLLTNTTNNKREIALKPDIVVYKGGEAKVIIDTKWKASSYENREIYNQGDIYQMYAYITSYDSCERCILLYPKMNFKYEHSVWNVNNFDGKCILIKEVSLESYEETKNDLMKLI